MTQLEAVPAAPAAQVIADVARDQRRTWAQHVLEGRETLWLDDEADPSAVLARALDAGSLPAAVGWVNGLERAESLALVERLLREVRQRDVAVVVAVPNTRLAASQGIHLGWDDARALASALGAELVEQHLAEAALIGDPGEEPMPGALVGSPADPDDGCAWMIVAGVPVGAASSRLRFSAQPVHRAYMAALETANAELERANTRLARQNLGRHDAGGASVLGRLNAELADARAEIDRLEGRLALEIEVAAQNDRLFQDARNQLGRVEHRAAAGVRQRLRRVPGLRWLRRVTRS